MIFIKFSCVILLSCQTINQTSNNYGKFSDLDDYKRITAYIMDKNYHEGFKRSIVFDRANSSDSTLINFMQKKHINNIQSIGRIETSEEYKTKYLPQYRDSIIEFHFGFVPIFGKRKELHFDFSSNPPKENYKKNGVKQIVIEKGIYYIEY